MWDGDVPVGMREWEHAGLACLQCRGPLGNPCGYVVVPAGHPMAEAAEWRLGRDLHVHGGVTFARRTRSGGRVIGFDMGHRLDVVVDAGGVRCVRTDDECAAEVERLAEQLARIGRGSARGR